MEHSANSRSLRAFSLVHHDAVLLPIRARGDRIMAGICWLLFAVSLGLAPVHGLGRYAPRLRYHSPCVATALAWKHPGRLLTRLAMAFIFMAFSAIGIDQFHGLIEMHFSIFALLAFLLYYRDWRPVVLAAMTIAVHHLGFCELQMHGYPVYVFPMSHMGHGCDMVWVHAAFVIFESACLIYIGEIILREAVESATITALGESLRTHGTIDFLEAGAREDWSPGLQQFMRAIEAAIGGAGMVAGRIGTVSTQMSRSRSAHVRARVCAEWFYR